MDGFSLDGILNMLRSLLPMASFYLNFANKLFDLFTAYVGFGVMDPSQNGEDGSQDGTGEE